MIKNRNIDPDAAIEVTKISGGISATSTSTLTNKTLTAPVMTAVTITGTSTIGNGMTITTPVLSGSVTGTYTLAGTPTVTSPTITGATLTTSTLSTGTLGSDLVDAGIKRCTADTTAATDVVPGDITGLTGFALTAAGTYAFEVYLQTNMSTNGGIAVCFKYTTATLTSIQVNPQLEAVAGNISVARNTTVTDQTLFVNTKAAVYVGVKLTGTMVVNAGGTLAVQMCQETSHGDTTTVYAGSTARFTRIA